VLELVIADVLVVDVVARAPPEPEPEPERSSTTTLPAHPSNEWNSEMVRLSATETDRFAITG
jgi:hypothetical protein